MNLAGSAAALLSLVGAVCAKWSSFAKWSTSKSGGYFLLQKKEALIFVMVLS